MDTILISLLSMATMYGVVAKERTEMKEGNAIYQVFLISFLSMATMHGVLAKERTELKEGNVIYKSSSFPFSP